MLPDDTRTKSVMLAKAMGWRSVGEDLGPDQGEFLKDPDGSLLRSVAAFEYYDPANMALAWRVLNWAFDGFADDGLEVMSAWNRGMIKTLFYLGVGGSGTSTALRLPPAEAQAAWLDKILTLAIEAGLVEVE